jgi:hypothetical protein
MKLTMKRPPLCEPLSLEETKAYLRLASDIEDSLVATFISASRAYVEKATGRALLKQGWELQLTPPYPSFYPLVRTKAGDIKLTLPWPPLWEVISFKGRNKSIPYLQEGQDLHISGSLYGEPLTISFWAGYGEAPSCLPPDLKTAVLLGTRFLYEGQKIEIPLLNPYKVFRFR